MLRATLDASRRVILSVGSGDGSQQVSFLNIGHTNLVTTFFEDTEQQVISKYPTSAKSNIDRLRRTVGSKVLFGVDATKLHEHPDLRHMKFDLIVFTFPHTGVPNSYPSSIESNKKLIKDFLASAQHVLRPSGGGEICITLKTTAPYDRWTFPEFGSSSSNNPIIDLVPTGQYPFPEQSFPGYVHRSTLGTAMGVPVVKSGNAITYTFGHSSKSTTSKSTSQSNESNHRSNNPTHHRPFPQLISGNATVKIVSLSNDRCRYFTTCWAYPVKCITDDDQ